MSRLLIDRESIKSAISGQFRACTRTDVTWNESNHYPIVSSRYFVDRPMTKRSVCIYTAISKREGKSSTRWVTSRFFSPLFLSFSLSTNFHFWRISPRDLFETWTFLEAIENIWCRKFAEFFRSLWKFFRSLGKSPECSCGVLKVFRIFQIFLEACRNPLGAF